VFFLLGTLQFWTRIRRFPIMHRLVGKIYILCGIVSGVSVLWLVLVFPAIGGLLTQFVTFVVISALIGFLISARRRAKTRFPIASNLHDPRLCDCFVCVFRADLLDP